MDGGKIHVDACVGGCERQVLEPGFGLIRGGCFVAHDGFSPLDGTRAWTPDRHDASTARGQHGEG